MVHVCIALAAVLFSWHPHPLLVPLPPVRQLQLDIEHLRAALDEERDAASKADSAPGRARQAADAAVAAPRALREEEAELAAQLRSWEAAEAVSAQVSGCN